MVILPPLFLSIVSIVLNTPLVRSPPTVTPWVALIVIFPASPLPRILVLIIPAFSKFRVGVVIVISPLFPSPVLNTPLDMSPRTFTPWVALITTFPALPLPLVLVLIIPAFSRVKVEVSIVIPPPFPSPVRVTPLDNRAFSRTFTPWVALIAIFPASPLPLVKALIIPVFSIVKVEVSIVIPPLFPSPVRVTPLDRNPPTVTPWLA